MMVMVVMVVVMGSEVVAIKSALNVGLGQMHVLLLHDLWQHDTVQNRHCRMAESQRKEKLTDARSCCFVWKQRCCMAVLNNSTGLYVGRY